MTRHNTRPLVSIEENESECDGEMIYCQICVCARALDLNLPVRPNCKQASLPRSLAQARDLLGLNCFI